MTTKHALGDGTVCCIWRVIREPFVEIIDPYEEHDFGSFEVDGYTIFFKIATINVPMLPLVPRDRGRKYAQSHGDEKAEAYLNERSR